MIAVIKFCSALNGSPMEIDGLKSRMSNGNGILSTAQLENRPYEISRDKVISK